MNINQINNKQIIKGLLIIIVIAVFALVIHKYLQFRTVKMEKLRVEQVREERRIKAELEQKAFDEKWDRCKTSKTISEITYKDNLLSVNLDCVKTEYVLQEISKKIGIKIVSPKLWSIKGPVNFNNLSIKDGLDLIAKNLSDEDDTLKFRYLQNKNTWSFDKVILEVKDPPQGGVTMFVQTNNSYDFVRADGTNKGSYRLVMIGKSKNSKFIAISIGRLGFSILNNQGEEQWIFEKTPALLDFVLSPNGKYMFGSYRDQGDEGGCDECSTDSYIINEQGFTKINKVGEISKIDFSNDGSFFVTRGNIENFSQPINKDYFLALFNEQGKELWRKNRISKLGKEIDFKILDDNTIQVEVELPNKYDDHIYYRYDKQGNLLK